jgi:hypothetical protein
MVYRCSHYAIKRSVFISLRLETACSAQIVMAKVTFSNCDFKHRRSVKVAYIRHTHAKNHYLTLLYVFHIL